MTKIKDGDWVTSGLRFQGTAEHVTSSILTIRLDPEIEHFRPAVFSAPGEVELVRDAAVRRAERHVKGAQDALKHARSMVAYWQREQDKARTELRNARQEVREAKTIPRRRPVEAVPSSSQRPGDPS